MEYWEANRERERKVNYQLLVGLPIGLLFAVPVLLLLFSGRFWYKRAEMVANTMASPVILIIAVLAISIFVAIFYKRHQWEMKEQQYLELKAREKKGTTDNHSG